MSLLKQVGLASGLLTFLGVSGCGRAKLDEHLRENTLKKSELPALEVSQEGLLGNWNSPCHANLKFDNYSDEYLEFDLEETNHLSTYYLDSGCRQLLYQQNVKSSYVLSFFGKYVETQQQVAVTPQSSIAVMGFTVGKGFCSSLDWQLNVEKSISNVKMCGIQAQDLSLRGNENKQELVLKECPESSTECYTTVFGRRNSRK